MTKGNSGKTSKATGASAWDLFLRALGRAVEQRSTANAGEVIADGAEQLGKGFRVEVNKSALAKELNVSLSCVSKIFRGKSRPSLTMVRRMSTILGVSSDELCDALGINGTVLRTYSKEDDRGKERFQDDGGKPDGHVRDTRPARDSRPDRHRGDLE